MRFVKLLLFVVCCICLCEPVTAYYHKFIAENSGTRKLRSALHYALTVNPNPTMVDYATGNTGGYSRSFSHILFVGTPKSISERTAKANENSDKAKASMIEKKKKQKKIDKELSKHPERYSHVQIPDWDKDSGVSMFVTSLKKSSKVPVDIRVLSLSGKEVCPSQTQLAEIKIGTEETDYIQKTYKLYDRTIKSDTIHIKYFPDPKCLVSDKAQTIAIDYQSERGKPIHVSQDMGFFKDAIMRDFGLFEQWRKDNDM